MICQSCGYRTTDVGEFHPFAFCALVRAGLDPWETLRRVNERLGMDVSAWPPQPPLVRHLPAFSASRPENPEEETE
jgi:hypothetical protein